MVDDAASIPFQPDPTILADHDNFPSSADTSEANLRETHNPAESLPPA